MKKFLLGVLLVALSSTVYADTDFVTLLQSRGVDTNALIKAQTVPRQTVAELLNLVDCQDCHRPSRDVIQSFTPSWWDTFRIYPGKNFDDILYSTSLDKNNMYYCIAYVGNQGYMNGFPRSTSPVCSGRFCGEQAITNADLIQTVFNITAKFFYNQYTVQWDSILQWIKSQPSYVQQYFGLDDLATIGTAQQQCKTDTCAISSVDELKTYTKYCTFEPGLCGMQEFPLAQKGERPVAELNILLQQGILNMSDIQGFNIEDFAKGSVIIDLLGRVKQRAQCIDDDDVDKDGIKDYQDNCYTIYNPKQADTDQDGIGNVCDDDIDNDTIKNPIGILDDNGNIVYDSLLSADNISKVLGLAIEQSLLKDTNYSFTAKYVGDLRNFVWYFGDNTSGKGITTTHTYAQPGIYTVRLVAQDSTGKEVEAVSTVIVGSKDAVGLAIEQSLIKDANYSFTAKYVGDLRNFVWYFGDNTSGKGITTTHTYAQPGTYTVRLVAQDSSGKEVEVFSKVIVGQNNTTVNQQSPVLLSTYALQGPRAALMPAKLVQTIGESSSYTIILEGISLSDIDYVKIAWGDGRARELRDSDITKFIDTYTRTGKFTIQGTVYLKDGTKLPLGAYITVNPTNAVTKDTIDNCLIVVNTDQADGDKNGVGNACDIDERVGLRIQSKPLGDNRFAFVSQYSGSLKNFVWYFGDRTTGNGETANHTYRSQGQYTVRLEATTPSGKTISATTAVQTGLGPRVALLPAKLVQNVGEKVSYTITLQNIKIADIDYVEVQWGDGRTRQLRGSAIQSFIDAYATHGGFGIGGTVYLLNDMTLSLGAYVTVVGPAFCLGNNAGNWQGKCDLDNDTIPDVCDTDIDGDTVQNPLGIIRFENPQCTYDVLNTDLQVNPDTNNDGQVDTNDTPYGRDNCPFVSNTNQAPCRGLDKDSDGDGILDTTDKCSLVPETFNGIVDTDGCPEYDVNILFPPTKLQPGTCNMCPCQYAENDSDIAPGDRIKAVLYDKTTQKPVAESQWYVVP